MKNPIKIITRECNDWLNISRQLRSQRKYQVRFYNVWDGQTHDEMYWYRFIKAKGVLKSAKKIAIFSCFGPRNIIQFEDSEIKIFLSGENLKRNCFAQYADHCLGEREIDLAMGLELFENDRYVRFPIWMDYMFPPESTIDDIRTKCEAIRYPETKSKKKFCCMVASNAADGLRDEMFHALSNIERVDSAGSHLHNDDSLKEKYADVKIDYMKQYIFNICPENTSAYGYTTEKLFESMTAGCIPIYWGAEIADKAVINEDAIIFWDRKENGKKAVKQISELYANPKLLEEFLAQPRLKPTAEEYILDTFATIEEKLRTMINGK
jgi:hypothetical protein